MTTGKLWMLAMLTVLGLASCEEHDNPVGGNPLASQVSGLWYSMVDEAGTYNGHNYTRTVQALQLNEDGTGYGVSCFFNDDSEIPLDVVGGKYFAPFTYTTSQDGGISLTFDKAFETYAQYYKRWVIGYVNGSITATDGQSLFLMKQAGDAMAGLIRYWDMTANGGAETVDYNINDYSVYVNGQKADPITCDNWRQQGAIFLYVGGTGDQSIHDTNGATGYQLVNLPWSRGSVQTNLPANFCNDITPENGWEWVLNLCGERSFPNNNFFAVYNKYLGILRFFYYLPEDFSTGNDHVWQVSITNGMAQHTNWCYGVPSDMTIKDKALIGQTDQDAYITYVTPWVDFKSQNGLIMPNAGWWAFDVDMSLYRSGAQNDLANNSMKLQMRSWDISHTSLYSTMEAGINGSIKADLKLDQVKQKSSNTTQGIMLALQGAAQMASVVANFGAENYGAGLTSLAQLLGTGSQMAGLGSSKSQDYTGSLNGTIALGMDGTIQTEGIIKGDKVNVRIASPTIYFDRFDTGHSTVGQGVWNLRTSPIVWWNNKKWHGGNWDSVQNSYFFDPNSIEIELNPDVFPDDQIEWIQVDAICGARKSMQPQQDNLRNAFGLPLHTNYKGATERDWSKYNIDYNSSVYDFLYASDDKYGLEQHHNVYWRQYRVDQYWQGNYYYVTWEMEGRGINGFAIEPFYQSGEQNSGQSIPFLEVNVKVFVKLKNLEQPIVLSRNYMPDIKSYDPAECYDSFHRTRPYADKMKGHTDLYDYEMKRIDDLFGCYKMTRPEPAVKARATTIASH